VDDFELLGRRPTSLAEEVLPNQGLRMFKVVKFIEGTRLWRIFINVDKRREKK